jgi:hypothetical protein
MNSNCISEKCFEQIRAEDLKAYVEASGWKRFESKRPEIAIFRPVESDDAEIVFPLSQLYADYQKRLVDAVLTLSNYERRTLSEIFTDILFLSSDQPEFRWDDPKAKNGTIPFDTGLSLLTGAKNLLLAEAHSVLRPQFVIPRLGRKEPEEFLKTCRIGQTRPGSFIITVICPLTPIPWQPHLSFEEDASSEPFARKVTTRLMISLNRIVTCANDGRSDQLAGSTTDESQISANACEALLAMQPEHESGCLHITTRWAKTLPPQRQVPMMISFEKKHFQSVERLAGLLRQKETPKHGKFVGFVDALRRDSNEDNMREGKVTLTVMDDTGESFKAQLDLLPEHYKLACDAHRDGKHVSFIGELHQEGRTKWIRNYENFTAL